MRGSWKSGSAAELLTRPVVSDPSPLWEGLVVGFSRSIKRPRLNILPLIPPFKGSGLREVTPLFQQQYDVRHFSAASSRANR